jgi:hypothetical protein
MTVFSSFGARRTPGFCTGSTLGSNGSGYRLIA